MTLEEIEILRAEYIEALNKGLLSINEVNEVYGKPPIDGGDIHTVMTTTGLVPVEQLHLYFTEKDESN